jgi:HK97 family phage portal protein
MNWLSRLFNRGLSDPPNPFSSSSFSSHSAAGGGAGAPLWPMLLVPPELRLTNDEMASTSTVWGCIRALVDPIASSEVKVFTRDTSGGRVHLVDEIAGYLLNIRPAPDFTAQAFKEILLTQTIIHGDGYAEIVRDNAGKVKELWPLQSEYMYLQRDDNDSLVYRYRQPGDTGDNVYIPARNILHVRGPSVLGLTGDSLIYRAAKAVALHVAQEKFATAYFANGASLGGFVKYPGGLSPEAKQRVADDFRKLYSGYRRAHGWAFLEAGMDVQESNGDPSKSQLVPSRSFSVEEIARYFGVPLVRLGVQAAAQGYGTNVQQLNLQFVRDTLTPWINRFTEEAEFKLFPQKAPWRSIEIDTGWLTRGDDEQRARANEINLWAGILSVNEVRAEEGRNGIGPDGDLHLVQGGLLELDAENLQKPEPPPPPALPPKPEEPEEEDDDAPDVEAAVERYSRRVQARVADLHRKGKTPDEILANVAATLLPKALEEIRAATSAGIDPAAPEQDTEPVKPDPATVAA